MKNNISLDTVHYDKRRVEYFLNNVNEALEPVPFQLAELNGVDDGITGFKFRVKNRVASVIVIFTESYFDAAKIEAANRDTIPDIRWTVNGAILFGVESDDEDLLKEMLSFFAGRE